MNREQLAHVLRACSQVAGDPDILVIGSQAILGTFDEDELPAPATASREADIAFLDDPGGQKADQVDAAIGELSPFDEQFGYYAQGVEVRTAVLPAGWADRLTTWQSQSSGDARAVFLEPHDLALAKLAAFRDKDRAFVVALLDAKLLSADTLIDRLTDLPVPPQTRDRITGFLRHWTGAVALAGRRAVERQACDGTPRAWSDQDPRTRGTASASPSPARPSPPRTR